MDNFIKYLEHVQEKFSRLVKAYDLLYEVFLYLAKNVPSDQKGLLLLHKLRDYFDYDDSE